MLWKLKWGVGAAFAVGLLPAPPALALTRMPAVAPDDYVAIRQLYFQYSQDLDFGDEAHLATLFAPGATISSLATGHRPAPISGGLKTLAAQEVAGVRHLVSNILLTPAVGDAVSGQAYGLVIVETPAEGGVIKGLPSFYRDTLVRTADGWRFKAREVWTAKEQSLKARGR